MSNQYFQFKRFRIEQDQCAMKVSTDACVFGAYIDPIKKSRILDIGTGTGLLALMVAQKSSATIDAVELDASAAAQAQQNFATSPFADRLHVFHTSIQEFAKNAEHRPYDLILCNPPFFQDCIRSANSARRMARHTDTLSFSDLAQCIDSLLHPRGEFYVHIPIEFEKPFLEQTKPSGLHFNHRATLQHQPHTAPIRIIYRGAKTSSPLTTDKLILRSTDNTSYTERMHAMLLPYYASLN